MVINICLIVIVIITGMLLSSYNKFVRANNGVSEAESAIDVLLNQRFDLLPNIIETVKGYTKHEAGTLEELVKLRSSYNNDGFSIDETEKINKRFGSIMALAESYPELKANSQFMSLQSTLSDIEDKLNDARLYYNNSVTRYNNMVESIPSNIVAKIFGFSKKELFKLDDSKKENIKVSF